MMRLRRKHAPGTKAWHLAIAVSSLQQVRRLRAQMRQTVPDAHKYALHAVTRAAVQEYYRKFVLQSVHDVLFYPAFAAFLVTPLWWYWTSLRLRIGPGQLNSVSWQSLGRWIGFSASAVAISLLFMGLLGGMVIVGSKTRVRREKPSRMWMWFLILIVAVLTTTAWFAPQSGSYWPECAAAAAAAIAAFFLMGFISLLLNTLIGWRLERATLVSNADGLVLMSIVRALDALSRQQHTWYDPRIRSGIMNSLEIAAIALERFWWRRLRSKDAATDLWARNVCRRGAAGLRTLKRLLVSPTLTGHNELTTRLNRDLESVVVGDIAALEQVDVERRSFPLRVLHGIRVLLLSVLPITVLWFFQLSALPIEETMLAWLSLGAYIWAVVGILAALDPLLGSKLALLKDLRSILRGPSGDTE